jgi:hypothetical protein
MPFVEDQDNRIEIFNEMCLFMINHFLACFLDASLHPFHKDFAGWVILGIASLNIAANLLLVAIASIMDAWKSWQENKLIRARAKLRKRRLENFKTMTEDQPGKLVEVERQLEELKAVADCKRWAKHRKWLRLNNVDFSDYPEEIRF